MAKELLVAAMHFREELPKAHEKAKSAEAGQTMTVPNLKGPLDAFLNYFDARFTNRKELSVDEWLGSFYALCVISIVKTILIDASAGMKSHRQGTFAAQLTTIYKVLVSVFSWSAKVNKWCMKENDLRDPLMHNWAANGAVPGTELVTAQQQMALRDTKKLVRQNQWSSAGIKHTKDFLLALGSGKFVDKGFNGFMVQKVQHKSFEKTPHAAPRSSAGTPQLTPLQPRRQPSPNDMDIDYQTPEERMNYIRPAPVAVPGLEAEWANRSNPGSRRSTMGEAPGLSYAQRQYEMNRAPPMGPPSQREVVYTPQQDTDRSVGWRSAPPKPYPARALGGPPDTYEEAPYYPPAQGFTAVPKAYDDHDGAYPRAKIQRRDSDQYPYRYEQPRDAGYRPDVNGTREDVRTHHAHGDEYRPAQPQHLLAPREGQAYMHRYQGPGPNPENDRQPTGQGSYYHTAMPVEREQSAKRRHSQFSLNSGPTSAENGQQAPVAIPKNGAVAGTNVFGINEGVVSEKQKPKRRELSKEQREQAAVVRRLGACPECKAKKVKVRFADWISVSPCLTIFLV